jgi:hypothetical protein
VGFLPEHLNPVFLALAAMGVAALLDRRRWWLTSIPALIGLTSGFVLDTAGASVHDVPLVPFMVEIATVVTVGWIALTRPAAPRLY